MEQAPRLERFLLAQGLHPDLIDIPACTQDFVSKLRAGLSGQPSPFMMLPTYLSTDVRIPVGGQAIAIDAGGTNLRAALVSFDSDGPSIRWQSKAPMPGTQGPVSKREFLAAMARQIAPVLDRASHLGFCFSFPADIQPDLDARVICFNKNVRVSEAEGMLLCRELSPHLPGHYTTAVVNDTAAAYMGGVSQPGRFDGAMGFILGTGTNTCYPESVSNMTGVSGFSGQRMLVNIEAAGFDGFPRSRLEEDLDEASTTPGEHLYEKAVSGVYLGDLIGRVLKAAAQSGLIGPGFTSLPAFDMAAVDAFLQGRGDDPLSNACGNLEDAEAAAWLCGQCMERAARLVTVNLSAVLLQGNFGIDAPARIITEGSTFWRCQAYQTRIQDNMEAYAGRVLGRQWRFFQAADANLIGAAAAALCKIQ